MPIPGCNDAIIDLPRHLHSNKHRWTKEDSKKARGVFDLRKERSKTSSTEKKSQKDKVYLHFM